MSESELRQRFEAWASSDGAWPRAIERNGDGGTYRLLTIELAWSHWRACAEAMRRVVPEGYALISLDTLRGWGKIGFLPENTRLEVSQEAVG